MEPHHLQLAAEFAQITGKANLVEYLGLPPGATPDEARAALRARRKRMQGMQSNPKYRREAVFLIKHASSFDTLLEDLDAYKQASQDSVEATQLPILEMAIRGALAGGPLSDAQKGHVRGMADTLGISPKTFDKTVARLTAEHLATAGPVDPAPPSTAPTAPPVRARSHGPPPLRSVSGLGETLGMDRALRPPQIEIIGDPIRYVELRRTPVVHEIRVRQRGKDPAPSRVSADAGWLTVSPRVLDPTRREQTISVHVDPSKVDNPPQSAVVHIVTENEGRATIVFEAIAPLGPPTRRPLIIGGVIVLVAVVLLALLYSQGLLTGSSTP